MLLQIDFKSGKPVYLQLVDQIRYAAASGGLHTGEPLPSIRPLAEELRVNRNTVAKAYARTGKSGIIETVPGKGCFLKGSNSPFTKSARGENFDQEIDRGGCCRAPLASGPQRISCAGQGTARQF